MAKIRLAEPADAPAIAAIYRPSVETTAITFENVPPGAPEIERRIELTLRVAPWLVCVRDGGVAGYAYASLHNERAAYAWSTNVSAYVHGDLQRRGVGRGLYTSLLALLRLQGYYAAHAGITLPNDSSVGLHEEMGFQKIGVYRAVGFKLGAWHDVGWWQLALRERAGVPAPVVGLRQLECSDAWRTALTSGQPLVRF